MDIYELRNQIDSIDDKLVQLFVDRMAVSGKIGAYKQTMGLPVMDATREEAKLQDIAAKAGPEMADYACMLYKKVFELSRLYQDKTANEVL